MRDGELPVPLVQVPPHVHAGRRRLLVPGGSSQHVGGKSAAAAAASSLCVQVSHLLHQLRVMFGFEQKKSRLFHRFRSVFLGSFSSFDPGFQLHSLAASALSPVFTPSCWKGYLRQTFHRFKV